MNVESLPLSPVPQWRAKMRERIPQARMIAHFIRRDFVGHRFYWAILAGFTVLSALFTIRSADAWWLLAAAYLLFAMAPLNGIAGVTWRSQHVMSRNYLLALPVPRKQMFATIQFRALVFWLPLFAFFTIIPLAWNSGRLNWTASRYTCVVLTLMGLAVWCINMMIAAQLNWERIASYLNQRQRFKAWVTVTAILMLECQIAVVAFLLATSQRLGFLLPVVAVAALASIRYFTNERRWTVG